MERDHCLAHTGHNLMLFEWDLGHHVAVDSEVVSVLENGTTFGGPCFQEVVSQVLCSRAVGVDQPDVINVKTQEEGLGQSDGHLILATVQFHSLGYWK